MSIDRSLRAASSLARHRNVLTRTERIQQLIEEGKWGSSSAALGLPKVGHRKGRAGKKKEAKEEAVAEKPGK
jgi:small basic protein (TIGR04137 family)